MKIAKIIMLMAALALVGCSSDDDDNSSRPFTFVEAAQPSWSVDLVGNDVAPSWLAPDPTLFESSMFIMVKLQDELVPYSTDDDLMTVFINGDCRTVPSKRNVDQSGNIYFVLKIRGNGNDRDVLFALSYYSAGLHRIFTLEGQQTFATEVTYGYAEDFVPPLLSGCTKYPVQNTLTVNLPAKAPFTAADGDCVAVFVGNECRGVGTVGKPFTVFRTAENETLQLRYYSAQKGGVYTLTQTVTLTAQEEKSVLLEW